MDNNQEILKAQELMMETAFAPAFIKTCADRGLTFATQEDQQKAFETAAIVMSLRKQANQGGNSALLGAGHQLAVKYAHDLGLELPGSPGTLANPLSPITDALSQNPQTKAALETLAKATAGQGA